MKKKILTAAVLALLVGGVVWSYNRFTSDSSDSLPTDQSQTDQLNAADQTNTNEKDLSDETTSDSSGDQTNTSPHSTTPKKSATVSITQADGDDPNLVQVRAYANVFEDGKCTITFTKGSTVKTYTVNTEIEAQYTQCDPLQVPKNEFSAGTWTVKVTFESSTYRGSATRQFSI